MRVSQSELDSFHRFASQELSRGRDMNIQDLVSQWLAQQERAESIASIQRGVEDAEADRTRDLREVDISIRARLGFPERSR